MREFGDSIGAYALEKQRLAWIQSRRENNSNVNSKIYLPIEPVKKLIDLFSTRRYYSDDKSYMNTFNESIFNFARLDYLTCSVRKDFCTILGKDNIARMLKDLKDFLSNWEEKKFSWKTSNSKILANAYKEDMIRNDEDPAKIKTVDPNNFNFYFLYHNLCNIPKVIYNNNERINVTEEINAQIKDIFKKIPFISSKTDEAGKAYLEEQQQKSAAAIGGNKKTKRCRIKKKSSRQRRKIRKSRKVKKVKRT